MSAKTTITPACQAIFKELDNEVVWLHLRWKTFRCLYSPSRPRIALLNESAGGFFGELQAVLGEYLIVNICRISDRVDHGGRQNLVLGQLPRHLSPSTDAALIAKLETLIGDAEDAVKPLQTWRHKQVAHSDLQIKLGSVPSLPGIHDVHLQDAIDAITKVMVEFHIATTGKTMLYTMAIDPTGPEELIECLKQAREFRRLSLDDPELRGRYRENKKQDPEV